MLSLEINKIDLKKNRINTFVINDIKIGVIYTNQKYNIFKMTCPHMGGDLNLGKYCLKEMRIQCLWHGYIYSLENGAFIENPNLVDTEIGRVNSKHYNPNDFSCSNLNLEMLSYENKIETIIVNI